MPINPWRGCSLLCHSLSWSVNVPERSSPPLKYLCNYHGVGGSVVLIITRCVKCLACQLPTVTFIAKKCSDRIKSVYNPSLEVSGTMFRDIKGNLYVRIFPSFFDQTSHPYLDGLAHRRIYYQKGFSNII